VPPARRDPVYHGEAIAVLAVIVAGALLGSIVLPQYAGLRPVFSAQPLQRAPSPPAPPAALAPQPAAPGGSVRVLTEESVVINVVKQVRPSVVNINTESQVQTMFGVFPQQGAGSGVIVRPDGYILTNNHVVQGATTIKVTLIGGKTLTGRIVGRDPASDIAVLKVEKPGLVTATLGESKNVVVGDPVVAIGSPLGLAGTVTSGIVSALNRPVALSGEGSDTNAVISAIQTDAAINPGNSGGALVDATGAVIGINSAIASLGSSGGSQGGSIGLGFAIPIDTVKTIAQELISTGKAVHATLAVNTRSVTDGRKDGALVLNVEPNGPGAKAGIREQDVIIAGLLRRYRYASLAHFITLGRDQGTPLLATGVRYFFRRAVEKDEQLFRGLAIAGIERLGETQERGFRELEALLDGQAQRLEGLLDAVFAQLGEIKEAVGEAHGAVDLRLHIFASSLHAI